VVKAPVITLTTLRRTDATRRGAIALSPRDSSAMADHRSVTPEVAGSSPSAPVLRSACKYDTFVVCPRHAYRVVDETWPNGRTENARKLGHPEVACAPAARTENGSRAIAGSSSRRNDEREPRR
jgi:hypothetical protein